MGETEIERRRAARIGAMPRGRFQRDSLLSEDQSQKAETFSERHTENGLDEDLAGCGRITTNGFSGLGADNADSDSAAEKTSSSSDVTTNFSEDHLIRFLSVWLLFVLSVVHV